MKQDRPKVGPLRFKVRASTTMLEFLAQRYPGSHRTKLRQRLAHHGVRMAGKFITNPKTPLNAGDEVEILREPVRAEPLPPGMRIVWKDERLILIHKPSGLLSMANEKEKRKTAYWHLTDWNREDLGDPRARIFIIHRLDRDASGLLLFARDEETKKRLQDHWDEVEKIYGVVTDGIPKPAEGTWRSKMTEGPQFRMKSHSSRSRTAEGQDAVTHYRTLRTRNGMAFLEVRLETGRKNQIRVHAAACDCPVVGDSKYGPEARDPFRRLGLHAWKIKFKHPFTKAPMGFIEALPRGFELP